MAATSRSPALRTARTSLATSVRPLLARSSIISSETRNLYQSLLLMRKVETFFCGPVCITTMMLSLRRTVVRSVHYSAIFIRDDTPTICSNLWHVIPVPLRREGSHSEKPCVLQTSFSFLYFFLDKKVPKNQGRHDPCLTASRRQGSAHPAHASLCEGFIILWQLVDGVTKLEDVYFLPQ